MAFRQTARVVAGCRGTRFRWSRFRLLFNLLAAAAAMGGGAAAVADLATPYQAPCPVLPAPNNRAVMQPLRLQPQQVKGKNEIGCLSPDDAIYAADGCPLRFCGSGSGVFQLP